MVRSHLAEVHSPLVCSQASWPCSSSIHSLPSRKLKMPARLTDVPPELISDILAYVSDPVDLAAFACTSSYLRFEATRALYTTVKLVSLQQTVRFCRTITFHAQKTTGGLREHPKMHVQSLTFRPRALHTEYPPLPLYPRPDTVDHTPRPTAAFFRLLSKAIATLPHLATLDLAWGFLYRHTHPTWTLDRLGTHRFLCAVHIDGVEDADALERFLARHRPSDGDRGCIGISSFENRSWLDLLDPSSPRGARVLKQFAPGLLPVAKTFSGPATMLKSMGVCAEKLDRVRVWSWGYGSADEELSGIHEALTERREHGSSQGDRPSGCGIIDFAYVSKTLVEDVISLAGTYLPDVVHLTIEGYELGKTPLPEKLPCLPRLESITIVARATRPTEKLSAYQAVSYTRNSLSEARSTISEITIVSLREGSIAQPADTPERQEGYARAWLECRESNTPHLERITWRPGPKDFHSMGP
ncbi:unnamed protein product [Rhizoctonia solani]|uniref:F-box domain-containing protein n=1 Tax=Rhizoctonia solani TaxID=456999 RepID=A0A8H3HMH0_9AGAM|nr:unnamed protein product [Rhizoctonia solani]